MAREKSEQMTAALIILGCAFAWLIVMLWIIALLEGKE